MVYFIRATQSGLIKIGRTIRDVNKRLRELQTGSAEKLELLAVVDTNNENWYHSEFKENRSHGEWFHPSDELLACIKKTTEFGSGEFRTCNMCNITIAPGEDFEGWSGDDICTACINQMHEEQAMKNDQRNPAIA